MFIRCSILYSVLLAVTGVLNRRIKDEKHERRLRLAGGYEEENGVRPYTAFLHFREDIHCSGAIVSATAELTAAHCCSDTRNVTDAFAFAGNVWFRNKEDFEPPTQSRRLSLCRTYNALAVSEFDIMICRHENPWIFDKYFVSPVQLFTFTERLNPAFKLRCQVSGFGRKDTRLAVGYLHTYRQVMQTWRACRDVSSEQFMCTTDTTNKTMCDGDAGGPVVCLVKHRIQLFGLLSTSSAPLEECCETPVAWNLITFLGYYRDWIMWNIPDLPSEEHFTDIPETTTASSQITTASQTTTSSYVTSVTHTEAHSRTESHAVVTFPFRPNMEQTCPCFWKSASVVPLTCPVCPLLPVTHPAMAGNERYMSEAFAASPIATCVVGALMASCSRLAL